jgi:hypothetical protein
MVRRVFGAVAGSPADPRHFVTALHVLAGASAPLWLLVIVMTAAGTRPQPPVPADDGRVLADNGRTARPTRAG